MSAAPTTPITTTPQSPTNAPKVKKWTQLCPEDFSISSGNTPSVKRRHSAPPDQLLFHTYPHALNSSSANNGSTHYNNNNNSNNNSSQQGLSSVSEPSHRYVFHHHPYMSKGRRNSTTPTPSPPLMTRRGSNPPPVPQSLMSSTAGPMKPSRRLSLPHNAYSNSNNSNNSTNNNNNNNNNNKQLPALLDIPAPRGDFSRSRSPSSSPSSIPLQLSQYKLCPLIEIVEEEIEHAKEFEMHKIHEATAKMHISNLLL